MIYDEILIRFGDLTLKGKNQKDFLRALYKLMNHKMADLNIEIENQHDRIFIHLNDEDYNNCMFDDGICFSTGKIQRCSGEQLSSSSSGGWS